MTETIKKFDGKSSETINNLKDIKGMDKKISEMTRKFEEKANKTEIEVNYRNMKTEIEMCKTNTQKGDLIEINRKVETINKETNDKYYKMSLELEKMDTKIKENKTYTGTEAKVSELIPPLSRKLDDKMYELNAKITKLTNTTEENKLLIKANKSTELNNLEQKIFNLENLISLKNLQKDPQRNITKTVGKDNATHKYYFINMCSDEEIKNVIENDSLFYYNVTIKAVD